MIQQIQQPPISKIGVMDLESFFPSKDRFELAMSLNNLLAAPGFENWLEGEALDISKMLYTDTGKPRMAIFSIAHLGDAERMFFVSLLLNQVLAWMRGQSGTTSLRAILYMDEIFGFFPPVANPPSKLPLMTILKQGRAFGLGTVLVTQNPVDLDYKGLSNAGTWLIGRLQTERDMARVLDGLEGATASAGSSFDRGRMEQILSGLGNRIFLMNNVHEDAPEIFETRWVMSYLRGPLTRTQIKTLMDPRKAADSAAPAAEAPREADRPAPTAAPVAAASQRPVLPPEIVQYFLPVRGSQPGNAALSYAPMMLGSAEVRCGDAKKGLEIVLDVNALAPITDSAVAVNWDDANLISFAVNDLEREQAEGATFADLPAAAGKAKSYAAWSKDFGAWLYRTQKAELLKSPSTGETAQPGEDERAFRVRLQMVARERRDAEVEKLRQRYAPKLAALQERVRRAQQIAEREAEQAKSTKIDTAVSFGASILGSLFGRKSLGSAALGKVGSAARGVSRTMKEGQDVDRANENLAAVQQQLADLDAEFKSESESVAASIDPSTETFETVTLKPSKANIAVRLTTLAWAPQWRAEDGTVTDAWV
ncbi:MAG TPA: ATP-binding protein, partial [Blastocatellia bacterium]|nr:ATP-binding protein [Blastocatellia bacterium]